MTEEEIKEKKKIVEEHMNEIKKVCPSFICIFSWEKEGNLTSKMDIKGKLPEISGMLLDFKKKSPLAFQVMEFEELMEKVKDDDNED